jgi:flagellar biosynthesis protein FliR
VELETIAPLALMFCRTAAFWHTCPGLSKRARIALILASCALLWDPNRVMPVAGLAMIVGEAVHGVLLALPLLMFPVACGVIGIVLDVVGGFSVSSISNPTLGAQRSAVWGAVLRELLWVKVVNAGLLSAAMTILLRSHADAFLDVSRLHQLVLAGVHTSYASLRCATAVTCPFLVCICTVEAVHLIASYLIAGAELSTLAAAVKTIVAVLFFMGMVTYGWGTVVSGDLIPHSGTSG